MKRMYLTLLLILLVSFLSAQTTLFTEGFESGSTNWTLVNGEGIPNQWHVGTAVANGGTHSIYVSDTGGATNIYQGNTIDNVIANSVIYFYRDVAIPGGVASINLSFDIRCTGEPTYDFTRVYCMPITQTPVATTTSFTATNINNDPFGTFKIGLDQYNTSSLINPRNGWNTINIAIPNTFSGQTARLAFVWINDGGSMYNPPTAIDNISLSVQMPDDPPLPAVVVRPLNSASYVMVNATLSWAPNTIGIQPTGYSLFLDTNNPPTNAIYTGPNTSYTPTSPLTASTTYYWRVVPSGIHGTTNIESCPVWSFTTAFEHMVAVGDGNVLSKELPYNMYFNRSMSQVIYYQHELADITPGSAITQLVYHYSSTSLALGDTIDVYLCNTTLAEFSLNTSWIPVTNFTQVFSGLVTANYPNDFAVIDFNWDPFVYTGENVVVMVSELNTGHNGYHLPSNWIHTNYPNQYRAIYYRNDTIVPSVSAPPSGTRIAAAPNTIFGFTPPTGGNLFVRPSNNNLGSLSQNRAVEREIVFSVYGDSPVTISAITASTGISTEQELPFTVNPGEAVPVTVSIFSDEIITTYTGTLTVTSNASNGPTHTATFIATVVPENMAEISAGTDFSSTSHPTSPYMRYNYTQSIYLPSELNRSSGEVITRLQYQSNALVNFTQQVSIYMGYTHLTQFASSDVASYVPSSDLSLVFTGDFVMTNVVDPVTGGSWVNVDLDTPFVYDATQNLVIAFLDNANVAMSSSTTSGFYTTPTPGVFRSIRNNNHNMTYDLDNLISYYPATTASVPNIRLYFAPPLQGPYIAPSQMSLAYGFTSENTPFAKSLKIGNIGTENLVVSSITMPLYMSSHPTAPLSIAPGEETTINFTLTSQEQGLYSGDIVFHSNSIENPALTIPVVATVIPENQARVGNGTAVSQNLPVEPLRRYCYSQTLYTPSDLYMMEDGVEITHIGYQYNGYAAYNQRVQIYMGHTNQASFSTTLPYIPGIAQTLVYEGPLTATTTAGWTALIPLTDTVIYNANQNLVVTVNEFQSGETGSGSADFYCTPRPTNQSFVLGHDTPFEAYDVNGLVNYSNYDMRAYVPNTAFAFEPPGLPRPRALSAVAEYGSISLSWSAPINVSDDLSFLGYKVYRDGNDIFSGLPFDTTTCVDVELIGGRTYNYYVTAEYDMGGGSFVESIPSNVVQVTAIAVNVVAHPPTHLVATASSGQVPITWQPGVVVMNENFETALPHLWLQSEYDGDERGWLVSSSGGFDGNGYIYSSSLDTDGNVLSNVSNFLISPVIPITSENTWLNYWIGAHDASTANELYWIRIAYPPSDNIDNFFTVYTETLSDHQWQRRSFNLSSYQGREIRIAFGHVSSPNPNRNRIKLDDVEIVRPNGSGQSLPLSYKVYVDAQPIVTDWALTYLSLPVLTSGRHEVWVTAVYDALGQIESTPSNVVVIDYELSDNDLLETPQVTMLAGNYPNPFNPTTTIAFDLARAGHVLLEIFNIKGQRVAVIANETFSAGRHSVVWNSSDGKAGGRSVGSGVYFYRMTTSGYTSVRKMILMK